jgi:hypothetical protein
LSFVSSVLGNSFTRDRSRAAYRLWTVPRATVVAAASLLIFFTAVFGIWTATSVWSFPWFVVMAVVLLYLPGWLVLQVGGVVASPLERTTLAVIVGMLSTCSVYAVCVATDHGNLFLVWPVAGVASAACAWLRRGAPFDVHLGVRRQHILLGAVVLAGMVPLAYSTLFYRSFVLRSDGSMTLQLATLDPSLHLAAAHELTHSVPPQAQFLAGLPLVYHYGPDLLTAMFSQVGLSPIDLTFRFLPSLFLALTCLTSFTFARAWLGRESPAVLMPLLVIFGEDFSFIPGLLFGTTAWWSNAFFQAPTTVALYFFNPILPALGVLFAGLLSLTRYLRDGRRMWLFLTVCCFAALAEIKIFLVAQIVACLIVSGVLSVVARKDWRLLRLAGLVVVAASPLLVHTVVLQGAGDRELVRLAPWPYLSATLSGLHWGSTSIGQGVAELYSGAATTPHRVFAVVLALGLYLVGTSGVRILGWPLLVQSAWKRSQVAGPRLFVACFVVIGPLVTLTWSVTFQGYPPETQYNNAIWFLVQSKYVAWIFALEALVLLQNRRHWAIRYGLVLGVLALSVPSAIQFLAHMPGPHEEILSPEDVQLMHALDGGCGAGEVVLAPDEWVLPIVALTRCQVPVAPIYASCCAAPDEIVQRAADQHAFWEAMGVGEFRADLAQRYRAQFVLTDARSVPEGVRGTIWNMEPSKTSSTGVVGELVLRTSAIALVRLASGTEQKLGAP